MHRTLLAVASLAAALLATLPATDASAQPPGGRGRGMGMGGMMSQASLVRQEAVQAELGLSADLKAKLATELPERGPGGGGGGANPRDMTDEQRQKWMEERRARNAEDDKKVAGLLSPEQLTRLRQIRVQALGAGALMDETLAKELSITDDQVAKLQSAMQEMRQGGGGGGNPGEMRAKMTAKAMEILDANQKAKLEALKGPAFDISKLQMRGPGGGGGRPGAGT
jgi:Spy/CpxP family protein refolding chaperone